MKKLLLIRHAKAVHDLSYEDFERPLTRSGIKDAEFMAERLLKKSIVPQLLITSPALRALATADIFSEYLSLSKPKQDKRIYEAGRVALLDVINGFDNQYDFIGLTGHNPTIEQIAQYLTNDSPEFATCAVALIEFEFDNWLQVIAGTGTLKWYDSPKEH
jgi:phosphohistidine phosphatase